MIKLLFILVFIGWFYFLVILFGDARMEEGMNYDELYIYEVPIFFIVLFGTFYLYLKGVIESVKSKKYVLSIICLLLWPVSAVVAFKYSGRKLNKKSVDV